MSLTKQKRAYADARLAGMNQKEAALAAGCPEKNAKQRGYQLERDADVQAAMGRTLAVNDKKKSEQPDAAAPYIPAQTDDPLEFFRLVMNDVEAEPKLRLDAAKSLAVFTVVKPGEKGKKEQVQDEAEKVSGGRFGLRAPGQLRSVK